MFALRIKLNMKRIHSTKIILNQSQSLRTKKMKKVKSCWRVQMDFSKKETTLIQLSQRIQSSSTSDHSTQWIKSMISVLTMLMITTLLSSLNSVSQLRKPAVRRSLSQPSLNCPTNLVQQSTFITGN